MNGYTFWWVFSYVAVFAGGVGIGVGLCWRFTARRWDELEDELRMRTS